MMTQTRPSLSQGWSIRPGPSSSWLRPLVGGGQWQGLSVVTPGQTQTVSLSTEMGGVEILWRWHFTMCVILSSRSEILLSTLWVNRLPVLLNVVIRIQTLWRRDHMIALSIFGCVCEVNCIIALILWINNLQKMENIRQTFTDASSLLSKAVKVTINKSNCWIRLIITHHRTQIFKMRPPWSSIVQSRYLENFSHVLAPQLGHEFDVW